jgi:hypothetical protein
MNSKDERLEACLRAADPPIADDGFSEAILARLPPKRLHVRTARCLSLAVAAVIGGLVTLLAVPPEILSPEILPPAIVESGAVMTSLLTSATVVALFIVPLGWLVYAEMADRNLR